MSWAGTRGSMPLLRRCIGDRAIAPNGVGLAPVVATHHAGI